MLGVATLTSCSGANTGPDAAASLASQLALRAAAAGASSGAAFTTQPVVAIQDAAGNTKTGDNSTVVTMTASAGATVVGSATVTAAAGVATFGTVGLNGTAGTAYTLTFSSGALLSATQSVIANVGAPSAALSSVLLSQTRYPVMGALSATVTVKDAGGNVVTTATPSAFSANSSLGALGGFACTNGVCAATFTAPSTPGTATVAVTIGGAAVTGSPAVLVVTVALTSITAGFNYTCGLTTSGVAYCWGDNSYGQLGDGTSTTRQLPTLVTGGLSFAKLTAGGRHTCGLTVAGVAYCWGSNQNGELGNATTSNSPTPTPVPVSGGLAFSEFAMGFYHTCARTPAGAAFCWGDNYNGMGGDSTSIDRSVPTSVKGGLTFSALSVGFFHSCGLTVSGVAYCWGWNGQGSGWTGLGQLGDGTTADRFMPTLVTGGLAFTSIAGGQYHTCGRAIAGVAYCWGGNNLAQVGEGGLAARYLSPVPVSGGVSFSAFAMGSDFSCGRSALGATYCWGNNAWGQLGDGTNVARATPTPLVGGLTFSMIAANDAHACGLTAVGQAYCWGSNNNGQIGNGTSADRTTPTRVTQP